MDDVVVFGDSFHQARNNLIEALERFKEYNLKLSQRSARYFRSR